MKNQAQLPCVSRSNQYDPLPCGPSEALFLVCRLALAAEGNDSVVNISVYNSRARYGSRER